MASDWDIHMKLIGHGKVEDGVFVVEMSKNMSKEKLNVVDLSNSDLVGLVQVGVNSFLPMRLDFIWVCWCHGRYFWNYLNLLIFFRRHSMRRELFGIDNVQLDVGVVVLR